MGMRSADGNPMLSVAAAAVALEAVGLCVAVVANAIDDDDYLEWVAPRF